MLSLSCPSPASTHSLNITATGKPSPALCPDSSWQFACSPCPTPGVKHTPPRMSASAEANQSSALNKGLPVMATWDWELQMPRLLNTFLESCPGRCLSAALLPRLQVSPAAGCVATARPSEAQDAAPESLHHEAIPHTCPCTGTLQSLGHHFPLSFQMASSTRAGTLSVQSTAACPAVPSTGPGKTPEAGKLP